MASIVIYELDADPFGSEDVTVISSFTVDILDDDTLLEDPDSGGEVQFDTSALPDFIGNSTDFETFETYSGEVDDEPVTFTLVQFTDRQYMFVTEGSVQVGQTIEGTNNGATTAPPSAYQDLPDFVCFTSGSLIETPNGFQPIEDLRKGDLVTVSNREAKPIIWIGRRNVTMRDLVQFPHLRPVTIPAHAFGEGSPCVDLRVSQQHRLALTSPSAELLFGEGDVLVPACFLVDDGVGRLDRVRGQVEFIHILLADHELVNVDGLWAETLFIGDTTENALSLDTHRELSDLFRGLDVKGSFNGRTRLRVLKRFEFNALNSTYHGYQSGFTRTQHRTRAI